jgi:hypothetical protein
MKPITLYSLLFTLTLTCCHSQRSVSSVATEETDLARSRTETIQSATADSLFRSLELSFDTLDVWISDAPLTTAPEDEQRSALRLRAVRGSLAARRQQKSAASSQTTVADTIASAHSASGTSQSSSNDTAVYAPPDLTWLFGIAIVILTAAALIIYRIRRNQ